jgi:peroxiredoxin
MLSRALLTAVTFCAAIPALAATAGQSAPDFSATDTQGKTVKLSDFKGKYIVLEWTNPGCPFVRNHYNTKNMQTLQKGWGERGVVWLSIDSTNGSRSAKLGEWMRKQGAAQSDILLDGESETARLYQAKTTPHMFVINPEGTIVYAGAIDDRSSTRPEDPAAAHNYVQAALSQATDGKPVSTPNTTPYGCSVKY